MNTICSLFSNIYFQHYTNRTYIFVKVHLSCGTPRHHPKTLNFAGNSIYMEHNERMRVKNTRIVFFWTTQIYTFGLIVGVILSNVHALRAVDMHCMYTHHNIIITHPCVISSWIMNKIIYTIISIGPIMFAPIVLYHYAVCHNVIIKRRHIHALHSVDTLIFI